MQAIIFAVFMVELDDKFQDFLLQLQRFCDYQERCLSEVKAKMIRLQIPDYWHSQIINILINDGFIDESRFATSYAIGKLRNNHWGKYKILANLQKKNIENRIISEAINSIDRGEYLSILRQLVNQKVKQIGSVEINKNKKKLLNYLLQKGFESEYIWQIINEI